ncbi:ABC transporter substrate-binding protein [Cohnella cellulosilytica]|uniref:ABC transporter substrate-binding protein n=1 Tax=Cohnella cellulosilytica TaxID=986710 RepID=A0ABW2F600_9BACL
MKTIVLLKACRWLAVAALAAQLAGCVQRGPETESEGTAAAREPDVALTLAVREDVDADALNGLIGRFEAEHPGVRVERIQLPRDRYDEMLHMLMTSGEGPDLFQASTEWLATYLYKNWLLDLSDIADERTLSAYPRWAVDYTKDYSRFYALPSEMLTLRLIYNKELFERAGLDPERPPETLEQLKRYAVQISEAGTGYRIYGFALPAGEDDPFRQALEMGGTYSGVYYYDFAAGQYDFTGYTPWFETMLELKKDGGMFPGETSLTMDTALTQFAEGNIGMMYVTSRDYALLSRMAHGNATGVAMPPLFDEADQGAGALMVALQSPFAIHRYTEHKEEAAALWNELHSDAYLGGLFSQGKTIPVSGAIAEDPAYRDGLDSIGAFLPRAGEESPYPKEPKFILENRTQSGLKNPDDRLRTKAYKDILLGVLPTEDVLRTLTEQYNQSLENAVYRSLVNMEHYIDPDFDPRHPVKDTK